MLQQQGALQQALWGLLGVESDKTKEMILKVQSAQTVLNGVQAIANMLNKDSILMLKIKQMRMRLSTAATVKDTVATTVNSAATKGSTIAQTAWNTAKAIGMALCGNFTGLLLLGAGALLTYSMFTDKSTESEKKKQTQEDKLKKSFEDYSSSVSSESGKMIGNYKALQLQWNNLKSTQEKMKFLKDNKTAFEELGFGIYTVTDAEDFFAKNTNKVVEAIKARAKAWAALEMLKKSELTYLEKLDENERKAQFTPVKVGDKKFIKEDKEVKKAREQREKDGKLETSDYNIRNDEETYNRFKKWMHGRFGKKIDWSKYIDSDKFTEEGAKEYNSFLQQYSQRRLKRWNVEEKEILEKSTNKYSDLYTKAQESLKDAPYSKIKSDTKANKNTNLETIKVKDNGSLDIAIKKLKAYREERAKLKEGDKSIKELDDKITEWKDKVKDRTVEVMLNTNIADMSIKELEDYYKKLQSAPTDFILNDKQTSDILSRAKEVKTQIDELKNNQIDIVIDSNIDIANASMKDLANREKELENLRIDFNINDEQLKSILEELAQIRNKTKELERKNSMIDFKSSFDFDWQNASLKDLQDYLSQLENFQLKLNLSDEQLRLMKERIKLVKDLIEDEEIRLKIKPIKPSIDYEEVKDFAKNSETDIVISYNNAAKQVRDIQEKYDLGLIDKEQADKRIDEVNNKIQQFGKNLKPFKLEVESNIDKALDVLNDFNAIDGMVSSFEQLTNAVRDGANAWEVFMGVINIVGSTLSTVQTILSSINSIQALFNATTATSTAVSTAATTAQTTKMGADAASVASSTAATVATEAQTAAMMDLAAASYFAAHAYIPFAGFGIGSGFVASMLTAMATAKASSAAMMAFANGGIVGGNSYVGDKVIARVNSGEMILNSRQQANLFRLLNGNGGMLSNNSNNKVEFKISGSTLKGVLNNYDAKVNRFK